MGKLDVFDIVFQNDGVCYVGQLLQGFVQISLSKPMKMKELRVTFDGCADVEWTEQTSSGTDEDQQVETTTYSNNEKYFHCKSTVYDPQKDGGYHPAGSHQHPFSLQLPLHLPTSFEGGDGSVRYSVKGTLDRPWKFNRYCQRYFTVVSPLDLNAMPYLANSVEQHKQKTLCCLCCKSGPISGVIRLNRTGFVPGEIIVINAECDNKSRRKMICSYVRLHQVVTFHAQGNVKKTVPKMIVELRRGEIQAGESEVYLNQPLMVPSLPPSLLKGCRIIDIKYTLTVGINPSGPSREMTHPADIVIGSAPCVSGTSSYTNTLPGATTNATRDIPPSIAKHPPMTHINSFTSRGYMLDAEDHENNKDYHSRDIYWSPKYPFYSWANLPQSNLQAQIETLAPMATAKGSSPPAYTATTQLPPTNVGYVTQPAMGAQVGYTPAPIGQQPAMGYTVAYTTYPASNVHPQQGYSQVPTSSLPAGYCAVPTAPSQAGYCPASEVQQPFAPPTVMQRPPAYAPTNDEVKVIPP